MFFFQKAAQFSDLVILGAGGAGTSAFVSVIEQLRRQHPHGMPYPYSITILEREHRIHGGFPYNPNMQHPVLRLNEPTKDMMLDIDNTSDFGDWLKKNSESLKAKYPDLASIIDDNNSGKDPYAPRMLFGIYCKKRMKEYVALAEKLGISVRVETDIHVTDAIQDYDKNWYLKTQEKTTFSAANLLIATGHLPAEKFPPLRSHPGYLDSPYQDLSSVPDAPIFILGTALSAIDAAKLLLAKNINSPIYMISPSGQLPRVKGPLTSYSYQMQFMTRENLAKPNLRLAEILDLFTAEVRHATNDSSWTTASLLEEARRFNVDPRNALQQEIDIIERNQIRPWQLMLGQIWADPIALIWEHLDDRDRKEFAFDYFPLFQKWAAGMTYGNSKVMADLLDKGQLHIIRSKNEVTFNTESRQFELKINDTEVISAVTVINSTGTGENIKKNQSLDAMTKRGLIEQAQYFGGLHLTPDLRVIDVNQTIHQNAWGVGYITVGSNIGASSMEQAAHDAKNVAAQVARKMLNDKEKLATANLAMAN